MQKHGLILFLIPLVCMCIWTQAHTHTTGDYRTEPGKNLTLPSHFARCKATSRIVCVDGECKDVKPTVFFLLGSEGDKKTYSRCDQQGCESYDAITKEAGLYENWQLADPQGVIFKRALSGDQKFVEVATLELQVYISFGQCETVSLRPSSLSSSRIGPLSSTVGCQPLPTR